VRLLRVFGLLLFTFVALWVFALVAPAVIGPIAEFALNDPAVQSEGHAGDVSNIRNVTVTDAPTLWGAGIVILVIVFAVFREQIISRGGRR
jgi:hypothetical protein